MDKGEIVFSPQNHYSLSGEIVILPVNKQRIFILRGCENCIYSISKEKKCSRAE